MPLQCLAVWKDLLAGGSRSTGTEHERLLFWYASHSNYLLHSFTGYYTVSMSITPASKSSKTRSSRCCCPK